MAPLLREKETWGHRAAMFPDDTLRQVLRAAEGKVAMKADGLYDKYKFKQTHTHTSTYEGECIEIIGFEVMKVMKVMAGSILPVLDR